jgi:hypothetical protein
MHMAQGKKLIHAPKHHKLVQLLAFTLIAISNSFAAQSDGLEPTPAERTTIAQSEDSIVIAGTMLPHFFHPSEKGIYNHIYDAIMQELEERPNLVYLPVRRASRMFKSQAADCFFIANRKRSEKANARRAKNSPRIIHSDTIHSSDKKIYSLKGQPIYTDLNQLIGKKVVLDNGAGNKTILQEVMPENINVVPSESVARSIEMLRAGRADAIIAYELDMQTYLELHPEEDGLQTDVDFGFQTGDSAISCWETPKTVAFLSLINDRIKSLGASGELSYDFYYQMRNAANQSQ